MTGALTESQAMTVLILAPGKPARPFSGTPTKEAPQRRHCTLRGKPELIS
jgi:hypothetical protein